MASLPLFTDTLQSEMAGELDIEEFFENYIVPNTNHWFQNTKEAEAIMDELEQEIESGIAESLSPPDEFIPPVDDFMEYESTAATPSQQIPSPMDVHSMKALNHVFPECINGRFLPSEFQSALLDSMACIRKELGHKWGIAEMATAQGKTILSLLDIERDIAAKSRDFKVLFLVHTVAIRDGAHSKFKQHFTSLGQAAFDFYQVAGNIAIDLTAVRRAKFVFCLFQSFSRLPTLRFTHVIIDETHHVLADTYRSIFRTLSTTPSVEYMLGLTATLVHRNDPSGEKIRALYRNVVYVTLPWTLCKELNLFPSVEYLECTPTLQEGRDITTYNGLLDMFKKNKRLDIFLKRCSKSVIDESNPNYITEILWEYQTLRLESGLAPKKRIIIFCRTISDADRIADLCNMKDFEHGTELMSPAVSAHYKRHDRAKGALASFVSGKAKILCAVLMVNEGFDVKAVDCVVLGRLTESEIVFAQQMGRGLRLEADNPDKEFCVLDLAMNLRRRWQRLIKEMPEEEVARQIHAFWHVGNFVGSGVQ